MLTDDNRPRARKRILIAVGELAFIALAFAAIAFTFEIPAALSPRYDGELRIRKHFGHYDATETRPGGRTRKLSEFATREHAVRYARAHNLEVK